MASGEIDITAGRTLSEGELITHQKLNDLAVPTLRIKELAITSRELADGSINSDKLDVDLEAQLGVPDNSVTTNKIVDNAVTTNKIAADQTLRNPQVAPEGGGLPLYRPSGVVYANSTSVGNTGTGFTILHQFNVPAGMLSRDGDMLRMSTVLHTATNANLKRWEVTWGASAPTIFNFVNQPWNQLVFYVEVRICRRGASDVLITGQQLNVPMAGGGGSLSQSVIAPAMQSGTDNLATSISFHVSAISPSGSSQVFADSTIVEFLPKP